MNQPAILRFHSAALARNSGTGPTNWLETPSTAWRPGLLCLDEPLSALDDATREEMYEVIRSVRRHTGVTALHVTHNMAEARVLADRILTTECAGGSGWTIKNLDRSLAKTSSGEVE